MNRTAVGVFNAYAAAGDVVRELELLGISGEQVEVVSEAAYDVRGMGIVPRPKREDPDSQAEKETMVIVRPSDERGVEQAAFVMKRYGAKLYWGEIPSQQIAGRPPLKDTRNGVSKEASIGGPGTTGNAAGDLEGRGKEIRTPDAEGTVERRPEPPPRRHYPN